VPVPRLSARLFQGIGLAGILALATPAALAAPPAKHPAGAQKKGKGTKTRTPKASKASPVRAAAAVRPAAPEPPAPPLVVDLDLHRATLDNGLRVVIDVDHGSPTVAIAVVYDAGARNEERGHTGLARLDERLMFEGSHNVDAGDHALLVASRGGEASSTTGPDRTTFVDVLPAGELALGLWLEADRMRGLEPSQVAFDGLRRALQDEQRARAALPYHAGRTRLEALVYQGYWPYEHDVTRAEMPKLPVTMGDTPKPALDVYLDAAELAGAQTFHASHHGTGNAVLSIAGDVDPDAAMALVHQYFDGVPRTPAAAFADPVLPEQTSQRTAVIREEQARAAAVLYGWAIPPVRSAEHQAIELAGEILAGGEGSRLHRLLVRERGLLTSVSAGTGQRRGPDLFRIEAVLAASAKLPDVERLIEAEIKALATRGPTEAELSRARRRLASGFLLGLASNQDRARRLGEHELCFGDARLLPADLPRVLAVTGDAIMRAAAQHLGPTRRTIVETTPPEEVLAASQPPRPPARVSVEAAPPVKPAHARTPKKGAAKPRKKKP
jgi:zinc protease